MRGRTGWGLPIGVLVAGWPSFAGAWATTEHQELGRAAYLRACTELGAIVAARHAAPAAAGRLEIACGKNVEVLAEIYGDAAALAGDFLEEPSEFISQAGAWRFNSRKSYWLLALENSQHFNPMATRSWAEYHAAALREARAASAVDGLPTVTGFELALHESAFADHFLTDAFAAGHMGFNRTASGAAASKAFHDAWNTRGRVVTDRNGGRWMTYGDGRLDRPQNAEARRHVMDAATLSVRGVLRAFVLGERSADEELAVWNALPFAIEAPELDVDVAEMFERPEGAAERRLVPLVTTIRPVRKDTVVTAVVWSAAPFSDAGEDVTAAVAGLELAVPRMPAQVHLGAGGTLREAGGGHSAVVDAGFLVPLGIGFRGLLSHQLNVMASWLIGGRLSTLVDADYQLNVELGDLLLAGRGGVVGFFPARQIGWFAGAGLGLTFSAAGGGAL
jgi:hypothetical protein